MKCRKCHHEMLEVGIIKKLVDAMTAKVAKKMEYRVFLCRNCEQPYAFSKKKGEVQFVMITATWLATLSKPQRQRVESAIAQTKSDLKVVKANEYWAKKMEAITE